MADTATVVTMLNYSNDSGPCGYSPGSPAFWDLAATMPPRADVEVCRGGSFMTRCMVKQTRLTCLPRLG